MRNKVLIFFIIVATFACARSHVNTSNDDISPIDLSAIVSAEARRKGADSPNRATISLTDPNYDSVYDNPYILAIRQGINDYFDSKEKNVAYTFMNGSNYEEYYSSPFAVLKMAPNQLGGIQAQIIFTNKDDKVFWVWVYNVDENDYQLRAIKESAITGSDIHNYLRENGYRIFKRTL